MKVRVKLDTLTIFIEQIRDRLIGAMLLGIPEQIPGLVLTRDMLHNCHHFYRHAALLMAWMLTA